MNNQTIHKHAERGATAVEFGLTVGLIGTFVVVALGYFGHTLAAVFEAASAGL